MRSFAAALFAAFLAFGSEAHATWWVQDTATIGSSSFIGNDEKVVADNGRGLGLELGHGLYSNRDLPGLVQWFAAGGNWLRERQILGVRALAYPQRFGSETEAVTLTSDWLVNQEEDAHTQALLGASYARHRTPLTTNVDSGVRDLSQFALQTTIQQTYFKAYQFIVGGSWFWYDRGLDDVAVNGTTFNSSELAWMPVLHPVTPFPRWSASFEFARREPSGIPISLFLAYNRVSFADNGGYVDSLLGGFDYDLSGGWRLDASYDFYDPSNRGVEHYVSILLRYAR